MRTALLLLFALTLLAVPAACERAPAPRSGDQAVNHAGIRNLLPAGPELWSGSTPEGAEGFQSLQALGIRTVISVDGARPDVEQARRFGLRYVHLPLGYGGVTREQALWLVRAATELPGPIYIHCHHGKHRGPTAAAIMRRCREEAWTADDAVEFLHRAGTDQRYEGLYAAVREFQPPTAEELRAVPGDFPETAQVAGLAQAMVELDEVWDGLKRSEAGGWQDAAALAVQMVEHYREMRRLPEVRIRPDAFRQLLTEAENAAVELETGVRAGNKGRRDDAYARSAAICNDCHRDHRDRPR